MGKPTGFMEYQRKAPEKRPPAERVRDWHEFELPLAEEELRQQGARCMDCAIPFCQTGSEVDQTVVGCPVYNLIPEWNHLVYLGQWKQALERLHKTNNFPEFTGRVCPAPCEGSCTVALNDEAVTIKNIERSIVEKGFAEGWIQPEPPMNRTGKSVAVVGSGPAGLAAAAQLNKAGHWVTVFERNDRIGGLLTYGIPKVKIEQPVIDRRVNLLKEEGISFVINTEIGKDISAGRIRRDFNAIILCTGALQHRELPIEGRDLQGIHFAMEFLHANTKSLLDSNHRDGQYISAKDKDVIVIGGGDTGTDCISTSVRHGCRSLVQFDIYPRKSSERAANNPWPLWPKVYNLDSGQLEAAVKFGTDDPRAYAVQTTKFVGDEQGHVQEVHTIQVKTNIKEDGTKVREEIPGTEQVWPAQLVLLSIGFSGPEQSILRQFEIETDRLSRVKAEYGKFATNREGIFAAGDNRRGASLIVWAISEGRQAARECDRYLMGTTRLP